MWLRCFCLPGLGSAPGIGIAFLCWSAEWYFMGALEKCSGWIKANLEPSKVGVFKKLFQLLVGLANAGLDRGFCFVNFGYWKSCSWNRLYQVKMEFLNWITVCSQKLEPIFILIYSTCMIGSRNMNIRFSQKKKENSPWTHTGILTGIYTKQNPIYLNMYEEKILFNWEEWHFGCPLIIRSRKETPQQAPWSMT